MSENSAAEAKFRNELRDRHGLDLSVYKETQILRRLSSYMQRQGLAGYEELTVYIRSDAQASHLVDYLDINVSEFFRNPELFSYLENEVWPKLITNDGRLKMWSAGCSNGSEPYSLAIIALEASRGADVSILGTDMDVTALQQARRGVYLPADIRNISQSRQEKHFDFVAGDVLVKDRVKMLASFAQHDILHGPLSTGYSLISCRNVAIYFTEEAKALMLSRFSQALLPGGILFTGATESYPNHREYGLKRLHTCFYQKTGVQ